jgi:hypothetical protein
MAAIVRTTAAARAGFRARRTAATVSRTIAVESSRKAEMPRNARTMTLL